MNKSKFKPGDVYSVRPRPKSNDLSVLDEHLKVVSKNNKCLVVEHIKTGVRGDLYWDSITDFRHPNHLMLKGQIWIGSNGLRVDPLPDPKKVLHDARLLGLLEDMERKSIGDEDKEEYEGVLKLILGRKTEEKVSRLKELMYVVKAKATELQIVLALVVWHTPPKDTPEDGISMCNRGVDIAKQIKSERLLAVLLSHRALFYVQKWVESDYSVFAKVQLSNSMGIPVIAPEEYAVHVAAVKEMREKVETDFKAAYEAANSCKDSEIIGGVLNNHVSALGIEGLHRKQCSDSSWVYYRDRVKERFAVGKEFLAKTGQLGMLGYLYHNTANQLRFFGEREQSIGLSKEAAKIAKEVGNEDLDIKANELLMRLKNS